MSMKFTKSLLWCLGAAAGVGLLSMVVPQTVSAKTTMPVQKQGNGELTEYYGNTEVIVHKPIHQVFSHKKHIIGVGLDCDSCHPDIFKKKRGTAKAAGDFTMKSLEKGKYCGVCHNGDEAFGVTDKKDCITCHGSNMQPPEKVVWKKPNKAAFDHKAHVEDIGLECADCHDKIFTMKIGAAAAHGDFTMASFKKGKYCGACHNGDDAFDAQTQCDSCHFVPTKRIIFTKPVKTVVFDHKIHVGKAKILCETCHKDVFVMGSGVLSGLETFRSDDPVAKRKHLEELHEKLCGTCHNSDQAFGFQTRCTVCHIGVKGLKLMKAGAEKSDSPEQDGH
ncbi:MAG TPA: hypothetical protein ENJ30_11485 [Desulfobulbaceae bacterium]|nr:hypothetical protein [Desulfobulbaceae bacterium]